MTNFLDLESIPKIIRDSVLFVVGLGGVIYETAIVEEPRSVTFYGFMAMLGLPIVMRSDEKRNDGKPRS